MSTAAIVCGLFRNRAFPGINKYIFSGIPGGVPTISGQLKLELWEWYTSAGGRWYDRVGVPINSTDEQPQELAVGVPMVVYVPPMPDAMLATASIIAACVELNIPLTVMVVQADGRVVPVFYPVVKG